MLELSQALDAIQTLPSVNEAKSELESNQRDVEQMKTNYTEQISTLRDELEDIKQQKQSLEADYAVQIEGALYRNKI